MQKIENNTIKVNRGDELNLILTLKYSDGTSYTFQNGDKIVFSLYNKKKMSGQAVVVKEINITQSSESVEIQLTSEQTKIGELIDKPIEYWYEIELNDKDTVVGYDEDGAKILMLYPEGSKLC